MENAMRLRRRRLLCILLCISMLLCALDGFMLPIYAVENVIPTVGIGDQFMVALNASGEAYAWGDNTSGTLGNGTTESTLAPIKVSLPGGIAFRQISVGFDHTLAIGDDGKVYTWGSNAYGQCGGNTEEMYSIPTSINAFADQEIVSIAAGKYFSLALGSDGTVYSWGYNNNLQLGTSVGTQSNTPQRIVALEDVFVVQINAGYSSASAITSTGDVYLWGENAFFQLGTDVGIRLEPTLLATESFPSQIKRVVHGDGYTSFLLENGAIASFGKNAHGQFGNGLTSDSGSAVLKLATLDDLTFSEIGVGNGHTLALSNSGALYYAGLQIGAEDSISHTTFSEITLVSDSKVCGLSVAYSNGAAILQDGTVLVWGDNEGGQLGNGTTVASKAPTKVLLADGNVLNLGTLPSIHSATISATVTVPSPTYSITIPAEIELGNLHQTNNEDPTRIKSTSFDISATGVSNLSSGHGIIVTISPSSEGFVLINEDGTTLPYGVYRTEHSSDALASGETIAEFTADSNVTGWILVDQSLITQSGNYAGVLNFGISVEELSE